VDANTAGGALISSGIGKEATNVVAAPATVPAKKRLVLLKKAVVKLC